MTESLFVHALHRTHVLKEATAVVIEIEHAFWGKIELISLRRIVEFLHRFLDFGLHTHAFRLEIERPVFEDDIFPFRDVHEHHLFWVGTVIIRRQTNAIRFGEGDSPRADAASRGVDPGHELSGRGIGSLAAVIVEVSGDTRKQATDRLAILAFD